MADGGGQPQIAQPGRLTEAIKYFLQGMGYSEVRGRGFGKGAWLGDGASLCMKGGVVEARGHGLRGKGCGLHEGEG
uniref:Uncharacterized protein n=1 Tax=Geospiza parvula TaxID=87175 RepID=A0A8C3MDZ3_GEOPR